MEKDTMTNQADNQSIKTIRIPISGKSEAVILAAGSGVSTDTIIKEAETVQDTYAILFWTFTVMSQKRCSANRLIGWKLTSKAYHQNREMARALSPAILM